MSTNLHNKDQIVKFSDIAKRVSDLYPDRNKWTFTRYVAGRHFEKGEIRIKKSNPIKGNENLIGYQFQWRFQPNDVLYVVKNPRLRKAAIVYFEGICSISTYVIRTDETKFLQKLLPFLLQTEEFTTFARRNQHGSTNPFLNWKDIAKFEFHLPSLDEQKEISNILWTIEEHIENLENLIEKTKNYMISRRESLLTRGIGHTKFKKVNWLYGKTIEIPEEWEKTKLIEKCKNKPEYGAGVSAIEKNLKLPRYIRISDLNDDGSLRNLDWKSISEENAKNYILKEGEILFARTGATVGKTYLYQKNDGLCAFAGYLIRFKPDDEHIDPVFLFQLTHTKYYWTWLLSIQTWGVQQNVNAEQYSNMPILLPSLPEQQKITFILSDIGKQITQQESHLSNLKVLRKSILNSKLTKGKTIVAN